jgi:hypothetical protein
MKRRAIRQFNTTMLKSQPGRACSILLQKYNTDILRATTPHIPLASPPLRAYPPASRMTPSEPNAVQARELG